MSLTSGSRLGSYEILAAIGAGGMGEVYRAHDTKLGRDVAVKILPESFVDDPERIARFRREAQVLASLNHPHIAAIYGLEEANGSQFLVLELVEGGTLADRLKSGPLPVDEALTVARQIAEALEAAHEKGIIHRDLKPANIAFTGNGAVKVLDFGLAKALEPAVAVAGDMTASPTITTPAMTQLGMILGTAAYMSPEQAKGKAADKRSDIWAFGCVLYEILTGKRAFDGEDVSETLAAVLRADPDWTALPVSTPAIVRRLLRRCVERDRKRRLDSAADARLDVEEAVTAPGTEMATSTVPSRGWIALVIVVVAGMSALAVPALHHLRESPPITPPEMRVEIPTPTTYEETSFALSPDGRQIVFVASGDGGSRLWLRALSATEAQPLPGTEGARFPFWSSDSRSVAFFAENALKRLDLGGAAPQRVAPVSYAGGGTWNADGVIVFAPGPGRPLMRVPATGGAATPVTKLDSLRTLQSAPYFLPDGRRFLFYAAGAPEAVGIYLASLNGDTPSRLTSDASTGVFLPQGWLLWVRAGALVAQRLDEAKGVLTGELVMMANRVAIEAGLPGRIAVSVSTTGLVAYRAVATSRRQLVWVSRSGAPQGALGDPDATLRDPRVSPDGQRATVVRTVQGNTDLWILDGVRSRRLTSDAAIDNFPVWSPDGSRIVFSSLRDGRLDLYQKLSNGAGVEERLLATDEQKGASSWSADGRFLLFNSVGPTTNADLWILSMEGERKPSVFLKTPDREAYGVFSPDGKWIAYHSNETGQPEIYVRPFLSPDQAATAADTNGEVLVSTAGGVYAVWRLDGKELYYLNPEGAMMAAPIVATGNTIKVGTPVVLFPTHIVGGGQDPNQPRQYDVAPDGRFLINTILDSASAPITLLQNWHPETKK
jgi:serine/threonine protein kinase/Tol biopolymer transport system component